MTTNLEKYGDPVIITPLKTGGRMDVHVAAQRNTTLAPASFTDTDIVAHLRRFFDAIDAEAELYSDDPIAMVNALARMEALLADVRSVAATIRKHTAEALADAKVRRITIDDVATMEATSESDRTDWQHARLMHDMLVTTPYVFVDEQTGEYITPDVVAEQILTWFRPEWRLTPIRDAGLDPDDYSTQPKDEDGKPLRTPTVRVHDNVFRHDSIAKEARA